MAAPFSALGFLAGAATLLIGILVAISAWLSGHKLVARSMASVVAIELVLYVGLLIGYSSFSKEVALAPGAEKYFCELDCHIAYTVTDVKRSGDKLTISLRTRFDERTIAPWRGDGTLSPSPRDIDVLDAAGHHYAPTATSGPQLTTPLRPGQSYNTEFTFQVPAAAAEPRLEVLTKGTFPERVLIGNENSFLHRKISFRL